MKSASNFSSLYWNQAAALVLAAAVSEIFPGTQFISGQGTESYFFCDCLFPFPFQPELLTLIEERMRMVSKEKREVKELEMVPSSAAGLLKSQGQTLLAERVAGLERATVLLCQIGQGAFYSSGFCPKTLSLPFFKLIEGVEIEDTGKKWIRVIGAAAEDKAVIKILFKEASFASRSPVLLAEKDSLVASIPGTDRWMWRPRGKKIRDAFIRWWQKKIEKQGFSLISMPTPLEGGERALMQAHLNYFLRFRERKVAEVVLLFEEWSQGEREGFFSPGAFFTDRAYLFCSDQEFLEECISSLHFILQIPKLLGFEFEVVLTLSLEAPKLLRAQSLSLWERVFDALGVQVRCEKVCGMSFLSCVEVRIADALGRKWTGPFVGIPLDPMPVGEGKRLVRSSLGSMERLLALLLEKTAGQLPVRFAPEQVRLLVLTPSAEGYAKEVEGRLQTKGVRVGFGLSRESLRTQMAQAAADRVPCLVLLGDKEVKQQTVTMRFEEAGDEQSLPLDAFYAKIVSLNEE